MRSFWASSFSRRRRALRARASEVDDVPELALEDGFFPLGTVNEGFWQRGQVNERSATGTVSSTPAQQVCHQVRQWAQFTMSVVSGQKQAWQ